MAVPRPARKTAEQSRRVGRVRGGEEEGAGADEHDEEQSMEEDVVAHVDEGIKVPTQFQPPRESKQVIAVPRRIGKEKAKVNPKNKTSVSQSMAVELPQKKRKQAPPAVAVEEEKKKIQARRIGRVRSEDGSITDYTAMSAEEQAALEPPPTHSKKAASPFRPTTSAGVEKKNFPPLKTRYQPQKQESAAQEPKQENSPPATPVNESTSAKSQAAENASVAISEIADVVASQASDRAVHFHVHAPIHINIHQKSKL